MTENTPKYIRDRFFNLRGYVWHELFPKDEFVQKLNRRATKQEKRIFKGKVNDILNEAALVLSIFLMRKFFADGTKLAIEAVDVFFKLNLEGFSVGSVEYSGRNENVMMGQILSEKLYEHLPIEVNKLIEGKQYPYEIIELYRGLIDEL